MKAYNKNVFLFRLWTLKNIQPIHGPQKRPFPAFSIPPRPIRPFINHLLFFYCWGSSLKSHPCKSPLPTSFSYQSFFFIKRPFSLFRAQRIFLKRKSESYFLFSYPRTQSSDILFSLLLHLNIYLETTKFYILKIY